MGRYFTGHASVNEKEVVGATGQRGASVKKQGGPETTF